ncbi:acyl-CoA dehydrogenase family protein [Sporosarcina sp. HYO08]|uniref:acyl-CoA dehydrogenase family protein n=1 Tax=Sporosarcina sp. HYO08 TaxID=1759557 RepID=UPI00079120BF|nr:acyl-CoA dehydrogenase family protein [Sporosarcina sp. HYO08]KXH78799.1 acyl-CoA dehydrogenase [Sporosarcina sp. HYO08]
MKDLFIKTELQKKWLKKLKEVEKPFKKTSAQVDELAIFPQENIEKLTEIGYTSLAVPKKFGGEEISVYDMVLFQETLASYDSNTALTIGWNLGVAGEIFEKKEWKRSQLQFLAVELLKGATINRSASEVLTGSPSRGGRPGTKAAKRDGNWVLNGRKAYTTGAPMLTYFLTSAWVEEKEQVGFFLLHKDLEGLSIDETWDVISMRGTGSHDLVLENVKVDESMLVELPETPQGGKKLRGWILHIPACYLGIAQAARDYAVHFANQHKPNSLNGPISQLPNVQQLIGEIDLALIQSRHLIYSVAEAYDDPKRRALLTNELAAVKHTVTNTAVAVVDKAMRIVGAKSLQRTNPLQRYYRDVRAGLHNPPIDDMTIKQLAVAAIEKESNKSI